MAPQETWLRVETRSRMGSQVDGMFAKRAKRRSKPTSDLIAAASSRMYLAGQGGSGKTEWAVKMFQGRKLVVLTPENDLADDHRKNARLANGDVQVNAQTYHHYLCIPAEKPIEE